MNCKNCDKPLEHHAQFCDYCGAKVIDEPFTFRYVTRDFEEKYLDLDRNLLIRTLRDMVIRPQAVINGYINGVRKRHLNLANWLAVAITISGLLIFVVKKFYPDSLDMSWMYTFNGANPEDNPFLQNFDPENPGESMWWMEYQAVLYILGIPIYAIMSKLTFWNQKAYSYIKHIVIVGYSQAFMSIAMAIPMLIALALGANYLKMSYWAILAMILFSAYVYKRIFQLTLLQIILRTLWFAVISIGIYIVFLIVVVIVAITLGNLFS